MGLRELDKEYREIAHFSHRERIAYCEDLVKRMSDRLTDDYSDTSHIRALILEMIEAAEKEIEVLKNEIKKTK